MDQDGDVINLEDSDVEFIGEEPSASVANNKMKINKNNKNQKKQQPSEPMETEDILPKNNLT